MSGLAWQIGQMTRPCQVCGEDIEVKFPTAVTLDGAAVDGVELPEEWEPIHDKCWPKSAEVSWRQKVGQG